MPGLRCSTEIPKEPAMPYVTIARYGGVPSRYGDFDKPIITARVHASSEAEAYKLAVAYNAVMCDLDREPKFSSVRPNGLALVLSEPGHTVYQVTHNIVTV